MFGLVQGEANAIQPGKRPLSSMTPTILCATASCSWLSADRAAGASSPRCCRRFFNVVDFGMNVQDAVDAPRFHHQWKPDKITMERGFSPDTIRLLQQRGHTVETASAVARVFAIVVDNGWLQGAADGRSYGKSEGF